MRLRTSLLVLVLLLPVGGCASAGAEAAPEPAPDPAPEEPRDTVPTPPVLDTLPTPPPDTVRVEPPDTALAVPEPEPEPELLEPGGLPPLPGAVMPRERIVAFYGHAASTRMGILGEIPPDEMLERLDREVAAWEAADPSTPVRPALHMLATMATADPGRDSLYRLRVPERLIERVKGWADRRDALLFLDIQPGRSTVADELPRLEEWLSMPDVHLALDPEWAMPEDGVPGQQIGSMRAEDVNRAIRFLARLVEEHDLPPKVLVVHRFTQHMLPDTERIVDDRRVQVVLNMDGWGPPWQKVRTYEDVVATEAPEYTGFKIFFKNDVRGGSRLLSPSEILALHPVPFYIQYQ